MRILVNNYLRDQDTDIVVSGESAQFPPENMYSNILREKTQFTGEITIDLQEAKTVDSISLTGEYQYITVKAGTTTAVSDFLDVLTITPDNKTTGVFYLSTPQEYRYWEINIDASYYLHSPYVSYTDADLTEPGAYNTVANLKPVAIAIGDIIGNFYLNLTEATIRYTAEINAVGLTESFLDFALSATGSGLFCGALGNAPVDNFASSASNGLQTFTLPKLADGDSLGGSVKYYYNDTYWQYAVDTYLSGVPSVFEIYKNGSVYIRTYNDGTSTINDDAVMVVRWDGVSGPAGGGVGVDMPRPSGVSTSIPYFLNYVYLGSYLQMPGVTPLAVPKKKKTDQREYTRSGSSYATAGTRYITLDQNYPAPDYAEFLEVDAYLETTDRINSNVIVQFEDNTTFPPFFGHITEDTYLDRIDRFRFYPFTIRFREDK